MSAGCNGAQLLVAHTRTCCTRRLEGEITLYLGEEQGVRAPAGSFAHIPGGSSTASESSRVERGALPHPHDAATWTLLPGDHSRIATRGSTPARFGRGLAVQAGEQRLWGRVRRTTARPNRLATGGPTRRLPRRDAPGGGARRVAVVALVDALDQGARGDAVVVERATPRIGRREGHSP
jgi:hypothetical protein